MAADEDRAVDVRIDAQFGVDFAGPARAIAWILPASSQEQEILREDVVVTGAPHRVELVGDDRLVVVDAAAPAVVSVAYSGAVRVRRPPVPPKVIPEAHLTPLTLGPWLLPSRFCPSDRLGPTAENLFPDRAGREPS
jgi:hypothetical protein